MIVYLRFSSEAEALALIRHYLPDVTSFPDFCVGSGKVQLSEDEEPRVVTLALPTHDGIKGGCPDFNVEPIDRSYSDEGGQSQSYFSLPLRRLPNNEPYVHLNLAWSGTAQELALVAPVDQGGAQVFPNPAFATFA